jgi:hypothetical protein
MEKRSNMVRTKERRLKRNQEKERTIAVNQDEIMTNT